MDVSEYFVAVSLVTTTLSLSWALEGLSATRLSGRALVRDSMAVASSVTTASLSRYLAKLPVYSGMRLISPFFSAGT